MNSLGATYLQVGNFHVRAVYSPGPQCVNALTQVLISIIKVCILTFAI